MGLAHFEIACHHIAMTNKIRKRAPGAGRKPKGPISGNAGWLQARIAEDLRAQLEQAAARNGRSLSQEAQVRLKDSFGLSAKLQKAWGPKDVQSLAYLVSRVVPDAKLIEEAGAVRCEVPLLVDGTQWSLDLVALEQAFAAGADAFLLCSPHNPLGVVFRSRKNAMPSDCTMHSAIVP